MKTNYLNWPRAILFGCTLFILPACNRSNEPMGKGEVEFRITDIPPSDDASIKGVFVTVSDLKVDGKSIPGFTKQTIDLKAFQDGNTRLLGTAQLDAKGYDNLTLVMDADADAAGSSPGCYVLTTDDQKFKLRSSGAISITVSQKWTVPADSKSTMVMDFDIRRSIRHMDDPSIRFNFVSDDNLRGSLRLVRQDNVGTISGTYSDPRSIGDKIIVYAYKKGTFNANTETQPQGDDGILFKNAVSSAEVKQGAFSKIFTLAFLEPGDYELHFAAYKKDAGKDLFALRSMLRAQTSIADTIGIFVKVENGITTSTSSMIIYRHIPGVSPDFNSPS